jgi:protein-tyrosine phosphatase
MAPPSQPPPERTSSAAEPTLTDPVEAHYPSKRSTLNLMPFRILTVCTGNICRSPQAEQLLRRGFADAGVDNIEISSAGTMALVGEPMPEQAAELSREFGGDPSQHSARQLTKEIVEQQDLILAMAREHRRGVAKLSPRASRYTFTLRELARIVEALPEVVEVNSRAQPMNATFTARVAQAIQSRGLLPPAPTGDDIIDPYRHGDAAYRRSAESIASAVQTLLIGLREI